LRNKRTPTALLLSRQNIQDLPASEGCTRIKSAQKLSTGAYILLKTGLYPKVILLGNGSEVAILVEASGILKKRHHLDVQIVSVPSEGLFRQQIVAYQREVIPPFTQVFGLTAGLPATLHGLVGSEGVVWGLDHFGFSAPAEVLDEKFGFTAKNVVNQVLRLVGGLNGSNQ